jgi:integrase
VAQAWAKEQFGIIARRVDPAIERAKIESKNADTFERHIPKFLDYMRQSGLSSEYIKASDRSLTKYFSALHPYRPEDITRAMVAKELDGIAEDHGTVAADRARANLSNFFGWLMTRGYEGRNPVEGTAKIGAPSRDRVLGDSELRQIWRALPDDDYGAIIRLLILLGSRKNEIATLRWDEVNLAGQQIELPAARCKNRKPHLIPLSPAALEILQRRPRTGDFVFGRFDHAGFSGWSQCKARLDLKINIAPWTVHDLRRTWSTIAHERLGVEPHVVEAALGHSRRGVAGVYNRAAYLEQRRAALNKYAEYITSVVAS